MKQTHGGGRPNVRELPYSTPQGPAGQMHSGPGLGGDNYGTTQQPVCRETPRGSPGIGGTNHGKDGSQG